MVRQGQPARLPWVSHLVSAVALGGILLLSRVVNPSGLPNACLFRRVTGIPCMTCGLTRAFHAISVGDLPGALLLHPLSPLVYGLILLHFLVACLRLAGREVQAPRIHAAMLYGTLGLLAAAWILRLVLGFPSAL